MKLRHAYLLGRRHHEDQRALLRFYSSTLFPLRALCHLAGEDPPADTEGTLVVVGRVLDRDVSALERLRALHRTGERLGSRELATLYADFEEVVEAAIDRIDDLEDRA